MSSPRRVALLRTTYHVVLKSKVPDDAPLDQQHAWWRLHDAAKHEYAVADWKWESFVLRSLIATLALLAAASLFMPSVMPLALIVSALCFAQCYRIFTRHAPE